MKKIFMLTFLSVFVLGIFQSNLYSRVSSRIEGIVVDADTGHPLEGVKIFLHFQGYNDTFYVRTFILEKITNKNGYFRFDSDKDDLGWTDRVGYFIRCERGGYVSNLPEYYFKYCKKEKYNKMTGKFRLKEGEIKHIKIKLKKGGTLKAKLLRKEGNFTEPYKDLLASIERKSNPKPEFFKNKDNYTISYTYSDSEGNIELSGLEPSGDYRIRIVPNGDVKQKSESFSIIQGQTTSIEQIFFVSNTGIKGKITINGEIPDSINVSCRIANWNKNVRNGFAVFNKMNEENYFIKGVIPGKYEIIIRADKNGKNLYKKLSLFLEENRMKILNVNHIVEK